MSYINREDKKEISEMINDHFDKQIKINNAHMLNDFKDILSGIVIEMKENEINKNDIVQLQNKLELSKMKEEEQEKKIAKLTERIMDSERLAQEKDGIIQNLYINTDEIKKLNIIIEEKNVKINQLEEERKEHESRINSLNGELRNKECNIEDQQEIIKECNKKNEERKLKIEDLEANLKKINSLVDEKNDQIYELKQDIKSQISSMSEKESEFDRLNKENTDFEERFGTFDDITKSYKRIIDKLYKCDFAINLISKHSLEQTKEKSETTENILSFIAVFGTELNFAKEIYNSMREYKKENRVSLTCEEKELICELNSYYKGKYELEFDVLDCLDDLISNEEPRFNKALVQDMDKPANTNFLYIDTIYTPILRNIEEKVQFKAVVKGR